MDFLSSLRGGLLNLFWTCSDASIIPDCVITCVPCKCVRDSCWWKCLWNLPKAWLFALYQWKTAWFSVWLCECVCGMNEWAINEFLSESIFFPLNAVWVSQCEWNFLCWKVLYTSVFSQIMFMVNTLIVDELAWSFWEHVIFLTYKGWMVFLVCHDWELIKMMVCLPVLSHFNKKNWKSVPPTSFLICSMIMSLGANRQVDVLSIPSFCK